MGIIEWVADAYAWGWNAGEGQDFHGYGDGPAQVVTGVFFGALLTLALVMALGLVGTFFSALGRALHPGTTKAPASAKETGAMQNVDSELGNSSTR